MTKTRKTCPAGLIFAAMLVTLPAGAADLDAAAVRNLVSGKMWITEKLLNSSQLKSFDWKKDGTLCVRLGGTNGKCDDSGSWKLDGARVCYELSWWLKTQDMASACLDVADLGNGRYAANMSSGTRFMEFTVAR